PNPLAGVHRNRALLDDYLISIDAAGDLARHRFNIREISLAIFLGGSADSNKDDGAGLNGLGERIGKLQALAAVTRHQLRQELFMDGNLAETQALQLGQIVINTGD